MFNVLFGGAFEGLITDDLLSEVKLLVALCLFINEKFIAFKCIGKLICSVFIECYMHPSTKICIQ